MPLNSARARFEARPRAAAHPAGGAAGGAFQAADAGLEQRYKRRRTQFHFDPALKLMSTVDEDGGALWIDVKGAPESVLPRCSRLLGADGRARALGDAERGEFERRVDSYARRGAAGAGDGAPPPGRR